MKKGVPKDIKGLDENTSKIPGKAMNTNWCLFSSRLVGNMYVIHAWPMCQ